MAISIYASGAQAISTPDNFELATITGPGAFVAFIDLQHHNGLEVRLNWYSNDGGELAVPWLSHVTADNTTPDGPITILSPPVPIVTSGSLYFEYLAGTPGTPANVPWVVYKL